MEGLLIIEIKNDILFFAFTEPSEIAIIFRENKFSRNSDLRTFHEV